MSALLFLLFRNVLCSITNGPDGPTQIYSQHGSDNNNNYYYIPDTFYGIGSDVCKRISTRTQYISELSYLSCTGIWCNGNFGTNPQRQQYEMEHIIDRNGVTECPTDILGNLVMAYGQWNNQVGQLNPGGVASEKWNVYGLIYYRARWNVFICCDMNWLGGLLTTCFIAILIITVYIFVRYILIPRRRNVEEAEIELEELKDDKEDSLNTEDENIIDEDENIVERDKSDINNTNYSPSLLLLASPSLLLLASQQTTIQ